MIDNAVSQEVFKRIDALAEKMGTTAQYLWPKLVAWEVYLVIGKVIGVSLLLVGAAFGLKHASEGIKAHNPKNIIDDPVGWWIIAVVCGVALAGGSLAVVLGLSRCIATLASPEAAAFFRILGK